MRNNDLRIIIIDDNTSIHQDFIKVLKPQESSVFASIDSQLFTPTLQKEAPLLLPYFQFETASQGQEGVKKIQHAIAVGKPYAVAFVDVRMPPGLDGIETIQRIWEIDQEIQVVICTAYSDYSWEETVQKLGIRDNLLVLKKPFDNVAVRQLACTLSRKWLLAKDVKSHTELLNKTVAERTMSLQQSLSLLRATIESSVDGIMVLDLNMKVVDYNRKFVTLWNIPETIVAIRDGNLILEYMLEQLQIPEEFLNQFKRLYKHYEDNSSQVIRLINQTILECSSQPHRVNDTIIGRVWSFHDITQQSYLQQKLEYQASHDSLTDLPNRVLLNDRIQHAIATATRHHMNFAVLFLDLDRFKLVNDSLSHEIGDELLRAVAVRLFSLIRKEDTLARIGGDEFVILIADLAKEEYMVNVAQKILTSFEEPFHLAGRELTMSTSIGISLFPIDGTNSNTLLRNADLAMYQAKELGGNQFKFYTNTLNQQSKHRLTQESELRHALVNNEFFLVYQPQFDISTKQVLSVEALIRWNHSRQGVILPLDFIPVAEECGLIVPMGEWVIREVCRQMNEWRDKGLPLVRIAVNVTSQQLKQANFAERVKALLQEYQIDPTYLEIEITENVIITHIEVMRMIDQLKKIGVTIVLDDFGIGSSSLNYLKQIHIDRLKIDQSFVQNIAKSRSDEVIIEAIMTMARSLNFKVVAEGVESEKQINFLKSQHCDEVQGFFLSQPLSANSLEAFFKSQQGSESSDL